jgi:hypothetical protein
MGRGGRGQPGVNSAFQRGFFGGLSQYTSELWLVHKQPNGEEHVQQLSIRFGASGSDYSFPPVQVSTSKGVVTVDITGRLEMNPRPGEVDASGRATYWRMQDLQASMRPGAATLAAAAPEGSKIQLSISRRARSSAAALDVSGGSSMAIDLPKPEEVLSFEFPALPKATEDLLAGHKFSIRLRVTPVK